MTTRVADRPTALRSLSGWRLAIECVAQRGVQVFSRDRRQAEFGGADAVNRISLSVFRFDDQALVTPHLTRLVGHDSPLMHLRRKADGGMFSRFAEHAEELWSGGVPVSTERTR